MGSVVVTYRLYRFLDTMRFKDNTPNAKVIVQLQELSLRLKSCFTMDYDEQDKVGGPWSWEH